MDGGEEQGPRDFPRALIGAESLAHRLSRSRRPDGVRGVDYRDYPFRATPPRIATALRFAKCALYLRLGHEWTAWPGPIMLAMLPSITALLDHELC